MCESKEESTGSAFRDGSIGIVGLGLIGGSIGLALRSPHRLVLGCDRDSGAEATARERFCVDRVAPLSEVCECDVVFLGVPPASVVTVAEQVVRWLPPESVFTDCASVKAEIAEWAVAHKVRQFVPGHPMAGHEKSGSLYSSSWMFKGARWILTPTAVTVGTATRTVQKVIREMGATPVVLKPKEHDRHMALLSHLPHVIAGALLLEAELLADRDIGAGSWKDLTRVGGVDPGLWSQILHGNRAELSLTIAALMERLEKVQSALGSSTPEALEQWLSQARAAKPQETNAVPRRERPSRAPRKS